MVNTYSNAAAQVPQAPPATEPPIALEVADILDRAVDAISTIEAGIDDLNTSMVALLLLADGLPDGAGADMETAANDLGVEANELLEAIEKSFAALRKVVAATTANEPL